MKHFCPSRIKYFRYSDVKNISERNNFKITLPFNLSKIGHSKINYIIYKTGIHNVISRNHAMIYIAPLTRENSLNYSQLPFRSRLRDIYSPVSSKPSMKRTSYEIVALKANESAHWFPRVTSAQRLETTTHNIANEIVSNNSVSHYRNNWNAMIAIVSVSFMPLSFPLFHWSFFSLIIKMHNENIA